MKARNFVPYFALVLGLGAQTIKTVPANRTSPASGHEMFSEYCAVCHGKDAKGTGPAASALKTKPADLTSLTARNNGKFPDTKVYSMIKGEAGVAAHGSRDMPIWGDVFSSMASNAGSPEVQMRISNLTQYVQSLQGK